jgi:hypothetical protein
VLNQRRQILIDCHDANPDTSFLLKDEEGDVQLLEYRDFIGHCDVLSNIKTLPESIIINNHTFRIYRFWATYCGFYSEDSSPLASHFFFLAVDETTDIHINREIERKRIWDEGMNEYYSERYMTEFCHSPIFLASNKEIENMLGPETQNIIVL